MPNASLVDLPSEIILCIFEYLYQEHVIYAFFDVNNSLSSIVNYFIGNQFDLTNVNDITIFQYCILTALPKIGSNLRSLLISYSSSFLEYIPYFKIFCPHLDKLTIYCRSGSEDIRCYASHLIHYRLESLTFVFNGSIVGKDISVRLLQKASNKSLPVTPLASLLTFHLSSIDDLLLLNRFCDSSYIVDGSYEIESVSADKWLTDSNDDLHVTSTKVQCGSIFFIRQTDRDRCCLEYELTHADTQRPLTVLVCQENEERWIPSSLLSTQRKKTLRVCSKFTFEKVDDENQFYIRPCYLNAKRLQVSGKRVVVSLSNDENTLTHRFRLHHIQ